jgi:hypothetical protein
MTKSYSVLLLLWRKFNYSVSSQEEEDEQEVHFTIPHVMHFSAFCLYQILRLFQVLLI